MSGRCVDAQQPARPRALMGCGTSTAGRGDGSPGGGSRNGQLVPRDSKLPGTSNYRRSLILSSFQDDAMVDRFEGIGAMSPEDIERLRDTIMLEGRIQIFLSSPFGGFEHERHYFMATWYPALQRLCASRSVELSVVDLRWGITAAQASDNRIIDVCLHEVSQSHIFVGMLGARYGSSTLVEANRSWIEPSVAHCVARYPWLSEFGDRSITEMEWLYARLLGRAKGCLELPSIFMLRDLRYDAQKVEQKSGEPAEMRKFIVESEESRVARDNVMDRVRSLASEKRTSLYDNYEVRPPLPRATRAQASASGRSRTPIAAGLTRADRARARCPIAVRVGRWAPAEPADGHR